MMAATARGLGWHPFPGPAAINSQTYDDRPGCMYHGFCNRGGCHVNAKNSTAVSTIPKAMATGRLDVVTQATVTSVAVESGAAACSGVTYLKGGEEYFQPADVVLLASYTYENVRLLLLSKSKPFPNGLANNDGQVGRHYFTHHTSSRRSPRCSRSTSTTGTGCRRRASRSTTGPTTISTMPASISSAAAISGSIPTAARSRPRA